jgi:hypothetical protein
MTKFILAVAIFTLGFASISNAQNYEAVDQKVAALKITDSLDVIRLGKYLGGQFTEPAEKVRAFYYWIANNISFDLKAYTGDIDKADEPGVVLKKRKGTSLGYANLFQEFCTANDIRCLKIDGYAKYSVYDLENPITEINHTWNIVQLGKTPDKWHNVDISWAAGTADNEMKKFTKRYTTEWFFTEKNVFSYTHFARIDEWRMANKNMKLKEFNKLPVIREGYVKFGGIKYTPAEGITKVKTEGKFIITIQLSKASSVTKVNLQLSDEKNAKQEPAIFTQRGNMLTITIPNKEGQEIPVYVYLNDYLTLAYFVTFE